MADHLQKTNTLNVDKSSGNGAQSASSATGGPLLDALLWVAAIHERPLTREAAMAGLPVGSDGNLTPDLVARVGQRVGLTSNIVKMPLARLSKHLFPVVLLLNNQDACVLTGWDDNGETARIVLSELQESEVTMSREELAGRYSGRAIYVRPRFVFDARAPQVSHVGGRHWFWGTLWENNALYRDVLLSAFLISLFGLAMPLFIMNVYDRVVPNHAFDTLWVLAAGVTVVLLAEFLARTMRGYFLDLAGSRVDVKLSTYIMERVLGLRLENRPLSTGSFAANLRSFETVRDFITAATVTAFIDIPFTLVFLLVIAWLAWPLVFPLLTGMAVVLIYALIVQKKMHSLSETTYRASAQRNATLIESLVGLETLKTLGAEGRMQRKWEDSAIFLARTSARLRLLSTSATNTAAWMQQLVTVAVIVTGVYLIADGQISMGALIACTMITSRAMAPIGQAAGLLTQYHNASTALQSLNDILKNPVERPEDARFLSRTGFKGDIELKNVSFSYPDQQTDVLSNISLNVKAGEHIGILGKVGSGKTTLYKLLLGLYRPTKGAVLVDQIDVRQIDPAELRRNIGYVPQDITLFFGTLRDNLTMSLPAADDAAVLKSAELSGLLEFVNSHPQGFDMLVGERGESLSGGQRQRVALGRALIGDPPMLLLDEPTGALDHSSEEEIKGRLREYAAGRTMLVVTHRTSLLELVDRLIVVDNGRIVADGPKDTVVQALRQGRIGRAV